MGQDGRRVSLDGHGGWIKGRKARLDEEENLHQDDTILPENARNQSEDAGSLLLGSRWLRDGLGGENAVGSRSQVVGREGKEKNFSEVGENLSKGSESKALKSGPIPAVPIRPTVRLGTIAEKAFRIQLVSTLILVFHSSLITQHSSLPTLVKMLQFLRPVPGAWFLVPIPCLLHTAFIGRGPAAAPICKTPFCLAGGRLKFSRKFADS